MSDMSARQGSASYTIVVGGITALVIGAIMLTFLVYPMANAFMDAAFWGSETTSGARVITYVGGAWTFSGGIVLIAIIMWIWVHTRQ